MMLESGSESRSPCSLGGVHARHQSTAEPVQQTRRLRRLLLPLVLEYYTQSRRFFVFCFLFFTHAVLFFVRLVNAELSPEI